METVFIDTSVFMANNFLQGPAIRQMLDWGRKGYIQILMPEIVFQELLKNGKASIDRVFEQKKEIDFLLNVPTIRPNLKFISADKPYAEFEKELRTTFERANCEWLDYPEDVSKIFSNYFGNKPPFHLLDKKKKSEFPDAFIIKVIEEWCESKKVDCIIFTNDKGMEDVKGKLLRHHDLKKFLDEKLRDLEKLYLEHAEVLMKVKENEFRENIKDWAKEALDNYNFFDDYANWMEVHDVEIKNLDVSMLGYSFTNVTKPHITFQSNVKIKYHAKIIMDDESHGYYDNEDEIWHSLGTVTENLEEEVIVPVEFKIDIPEAGIDFMDVEMEINHGYDLPKPDRSHEN